MSKKINVIVSKIVDGGLITNYKAEVGDYTDYYKLGEFSCFDVVRVDWNGMDISLFVDDEGMMKSGNFGRMVEGYPQPLFGNIIITGGTDEEGNTLSVPDDLTVVQVMDMIGNIAYQVK